ncbi:MAG: BrnT family toxin [Methylococcales bacterium]
MEIEFDPVKAEKNLAKHGISFEEALSALLDPLALGFEDSDAKGESRWILIGMS